MYTFIVAALLALALMKTMQLIESLIPAISQQRVVVTMVLAIASAFALNYSVFAGFGTHLRNAEIEKITTGIVLVGLVGVWNALLAFIGSHDQSAETGSSSVSRIAA